MATALVGLGSNLGDRAAALERAIEQLKSEPQIRVEAVSSFRPSKPAGGPEGQGEFLNSAARLETSLSPEELLARLLAIEDQIGRVREERWGPRVIDLDLLLYDREEMKSLALKLPHPRMCCRRFVLEPAAEIAGEMVWPVNGWSVRKLARNLDAAVRYLAIGCGSGKVIEHIVKLVVPKMGCRVIHETSHADALAEVVGTNPPDPPDEFWLEKVLELKCRRDAAQIARNTWPADAAWAISEYWLQTELAFAENVLRRTSSIAGRAALVSLAECRLQAQQPRLVIALDHGDPAMESMNRHFRELCRQVESPPSVWFDSENPGECAREVLAAMQAME